MNFSKISNRTFYGKILRLPLKLIPKRMVVPIVRGPLRGKRWIVGASTHGCWLGSYEYQKQSIFKKTVKSGYVVYDIGAHVGFYTLLSSVLVGTQGKVIAFEPVQRNLEYLKKHVEINSCNNVEILPYAVSDNMGIKRFSFSINPSMGHLCEDGEIEVQVVTVDEIFRFRNIPCPNIVKIDVEGAEYGVLRGAEHTIRQHRPVLFLSTHGPDIHRNCCAMLQAMSYHLAGLNDTSFELMDEIIAIPLSIESTKQNQPDYVK